MRKLSKAGENESKKKLRPALSPEARENQLISLAVDLAEERLRNGTASSQLVTHYLKLATTKTELEKELLAQQVELAKAKTKSYNSMDRIEELYKNALSAMQLYSGKGESRDEEEEDDYEY